MKKLFMSVALAGAMLLGACVDDNESESVTAVRNAKAAELQSVAAMNQATAFATAQLSAADAALKTAQAKAIEADVAYRNAETEIKKAEAEYQKAYYAAEIEKLAADLEVSLTNAKIKMLEAQMEYNEAVKYLDIQTRQNLLALSRAYANASEDLLDAQNRLAKMNVRLAKAEADLVDLNELQAETIAENNNRIAALEKMIENYEFYKTKPAAKIEEEALALAPEVHAAMLDMGEKEKNYLVSNGKLNAKENTLLGENAFYTTLTGEFGSSHTIGGMTSDISFAEGKWGYYNADNEFVAMYSGLVTPDDFNPAYVAPTVFADGFESYFNQFATEAEESLDATKKMQNENITRFQSYINRNLPTVEKLDALVAEKDAEIEAATSEADTKYDIYLDAYNKCNDYHTASRNPAVIDINEAQKVYNAAQTATANAQNKVDGFDIPSLENAKYLADIDVAVWTNTVTDLKKAVTDALVKADSDAKKAVTEQEGVVNTKKAAEKEALGKKDAAYLVYLADLSSQSKQGAYNDAVTAYNTASDAVTTAETELNRRIAAAQTAADNLAAVKEPYDNAVIALANSTKAATEAAANLTKAKEELAAATKLLAEAKDAESKAKTAFDKVREAYSKIDAEYQKLFTETSNAWTDYRSAYNKLDAAKTAKDNLIAEYDSRYTYTYYKDALEYYQSRIESFQNAIATAENNYAAIIGELDALKGKYTAMMAAEDSFKAGIADLNTLFATVTELKKAYNEAEEVYQNFRAQIISLEDMYDNMSNIEDKIADCQETIDELIAENNDMSKINKKENFIARTKAMIPVAESYIAALQKIADDAKAAFDAAME